MDAKYLLLTLALLAGCPKDIDTGPCDIEFLSNLQEHADAQDTGIGTLYRVKLRGYEAPYNNSIIDLPNDQYLMAFRHDYRDAGLQTAKIGLVRLDKNFVPIGDVQEIKATSSQTEDPRLVRVGEKIYLVYNDTLDDRQDSRRHMFIAEISPKSDGKHGVSKGVRLLLGEDRNQKNWVPWDYNGKLYMSFSLSPHVVLEIDPASGRVLNTVTSKKHVDWDFGELRGGTPAIKINDDEYLSIFHSSKRDPCNGRIWYFMGAYTFQAKPPFDITRMSSYPLYNKDFYTSRIINTADPSKRVVFPSGLVVKGDSAFVSYGENDAAAKVVDLALPKLLASLKPVHQAAPDIVPVQVPNADACDLKFLSDLQAHADSQDNGIGARHNVQIKGYEAPYNSSIIDIPDDQYLMAFRHDTRKDGIQTARLGLVRLDKNFVPISAAQELKFGSDQSEDPRLVRVREKIYIVYNDTLDNKQESRRYMFIARLSPQPDGSYKFKKRVRLLLGEDRNQKNWVPWEYDGKLYMSFSLSPHVVLEIDTVSGKVLNTVTSRKDVEWEFGELRGGTPAVRINKDEYLSVFHSSKRDPCNGRLWYIMGAYTFQAKPPFEITRISTHPLYNKDFYTAPLINTADPAKRVVFPSGLVVKGDSVFVSYGENDAAAKVVDLTLTKLLSSLKPVQNGVPDADACDMKFLSNLQALADSQDSGMGSSYKVQVKGYEAPYNSSLVDISNNQYLMAFRHDTRRGGIQTAKIGLVRLDKNFVPISSVQEMQFGSDQTEDPRLVRVGEKIYIVYNDTLDNKQETRRYMFIAELSPQSDGSYDIKTRVRLLLGEDRNQKNWVPWEYDGKLYMSFSLSPHVVLEIDTASGKILNTITSNKDVEWGFGELRGGSPAIRINKDEYLSIFHSSKRDPCNGRLWYIMGAYTFQARPPFEITRISMHPLYNKDFYTAPLINTADPAKRVVFPSGLVVKGDSVYVSYGENDAAAKVVKMTLPRLLTSLKPVH